MPRGVVIDTATKWMMHIAPHFLNFSTAGAAQAYLRARRFSDAQRYLAMAPAMFEQQLRNSLQEVTTVAVEYDATKLTDIARKNRQKVARCVRSVDQKKRRKANADAIVDNASRFKSQAAQAVWSWSCAYGCT